MPNLFGSYTSEEGATSGFWGGKDSGIVTKKESRYAEQTSCRACFGRWVAFCLNGIDERYEEDPWHSGAGNEGRFADAWGNPIWWNSPLEWPGIHAANAETRRALEKRRTPR